MKNTDSIIMKGSILRGDEGMWLPNALPLKRLKELYDFAPKPGWAEHVQKASVRMNNGGSASFVSPQGLLVTNHHVAESVLGDLSSPQKDYIADGFYAPSPAEEVKAPQLEVNILWEIEDVTKRVLDAVRAGMTMAESQEAKKAEILKIEKESFDATGLRSDVVTLYQGGRYHLYRYKKHTDVRLVFAPEHDIANFGGDFDNYEYPRYCLDVAFFRVYDNGQPLKTEYFFKWVTENSKEGDLQFISGHPGHTDRLSTAARIKYLRDYDLPYRLDLLRRQEVNLQQYAGRSPENGRRATRSLHGVQNYRKRLAGQLAALQNPAFMKNLIEREKILRDGVAANSEMQAKYGDAWDMVEKAEAKVLSIWDELNLFESGLAFSSRYFQIGRTLLRLAEENEKPNPERLREYAEASRPSLLDRLFSPAPIYNDLEEWTLADSLAYLAEKLGIEDKTVQRILSGKSPKASARELLVGTKLADVEERRRLADGGKKAVAESNDSFILLAKLVDEKARAVRKVFESEVEEVRERAYAKIAEAEFALYGEDIYPDATFTLRFAFGVPLGYVEEGKSIPYQTTIGETFAHAEKHNNEKSWALPQSWLSRKEELLKSDKSFNFVSTHDSHGGNSGSPVIDINLNIAGLLFDGNFQSLGNSFIYIKDVEEPARSISVHAAGIFEVLKKVYGTERLIEELTF